MTVSTEIVSAREQALQKIGRNVVNFQKMEAMLKFILTFSNFSIPVAETATHLKQASSRFRTRPMGMLVDKAAKSLHAEPVNTPAHISEAWISHSITFGEESNIIAWRREMRRIVRERNQLIHHTLASFDPSSVESCDKLSIELDNQRERILPAYEHLESLVLAIRMTHQELANDVDNIVANIQAARASHGA